MLQSKHSGSETVAGRTRYSLRLRRRIAAMAFGTVAFGLSHLLASFPGTVEQAVERAAEHAGQLAAYANIVARACSKPVFGAHIHLPISGLAIPVRINDAREHVESEKTTGASA